MELSIARETIKKYTAGHSEFVGRAATAERYYRNKTDILYKRVKDDEVEPMRNADNRVPSSFYSLLVNQKASYMFTAPPLFDVGKDKANKTIAELLGDAYAKNCKDLCINASNCGVAWVHYWIDSEGVFNWAVVDSKQVIPVYSNDLNKRLLAVYRVYEELDEESGRARRVYEVWTDEECSAYKADCETGFESLEEYYIFDTAYDERGSNVFRHNLGAVPFIPFSNNNISVSDLDAIKGHIDTYDKVYSGFINDLEDIQEIIFLLSGYEGEDLGEFLGNLKKYKTVKLESDVDVKGDLRTLTIDIPVEARKELLSTARKAIFEQGQGVDPDPQSFGNASGVALKYLYSLLELKEGLAETEFRLGFGKLVKAICEYKHIECKRIIQTWTRTSITNDTELAAIAQQSVGIISNKTILKNHPWVEDADKESELIEEEQADGVDDYGGHKHKDDDE